MLLKSLSIAAAGLAAATAFLLPLEVDSVDVSSVSGLPFHTPKIAEYQTLKLACPGCPLHFRGRHGKLRVKQGIDSVLELTFNIDHQPKYDRLLLNGLELYPNADPFAMHPLAAAQTPDLEEADRRGVRVPNALRKVEAVPAQLGFSLQWQPLTTDKASRMELISLDFQVVEIGNTFVDGIPNVHVKLIKTADGGLMIGDMEVTASQTMSSPMDKQEECTTIVCKWRAIIADRLKHMKQHKCGKMGKMGHHKVDGQHNHHHSHSHHGGRPLRLHEHSWSQLFKKFGSHILFPIFVGIIAGVTASM